MKYQDSMSFYEMLIRLPCDIELSKLGADRGLMPRAQPTPDAIKVDRLCFSASLYNPGNETPFYPVPFCSF